MRIFKFRNFFIEVLIATQIYSIEFILIDEFFSLKLQILKFSFIVWFFIKVKYTFFKWLSTKLFDSCAWSYIFNRMIHEFVDNVFDFHSCCIFKSSINLFESQSFNFITLDFCWFSLSIFSTDYKTVFELHIDIFSNFIIRVFIDNETLC